MINITEKEFKKISHYIQANYGIQLKKEKQTLVTGRLYHVLTSNNFRNFTEYYDYLVSDPTGDAAGTLIEKITTNHTFFMREADHFHYFRDQVLPVLVETAKDKDLRIWSAGCSSGEEPYTLAMILDEFLGKEKKWWDTKILATDISNRVLDQAVKGEYPNEHLTSLPVHWRNNYFKKLNGEKSVLVDRIRNEVIYRKFNLMENVFPFKRKFHVIFCRNVMIYFNDETKLDLAGKFYHWTEPGGYLFVGHAESLNRDLCRYKYIIPAVYRKE
ncbi:CheR family methyltransferase [Candidatus Formimonas warabiya]|uniref:CheR family methyltransferase n=1 Tax=Formimonas warabiya TaxID=1761012 RepID=UPI0011D11B36|nr:protein-glutamate O-methyltransferase CheR [Candidatus Formimonas warabiya]